MFERIIAFIMALLMSLSFTGCKSAKSVADTNDSATPTDITLTEPYTVGRNETEPTDLHIPTVSQETTEDPNLGKDISNGSEDTAEPTAPIDTTLPTAPSEEPTDPAPTDPKPTNPQPTDPKPTEPKPTDPPAPTNPVHTHNYKATVVAPTCTNKGYTEYKCSCGASYKDNYKNALGHNYKVTGNGTATCTSGGYTEKKCTRCGDTQRTQTAALGHDYQETGFTSATCTAPFTVNYKCSRCGATTQETSGEPLGHSWVHHDAETHWRYGYQCYCGAIFWTYEEWSDHFDSFSYAEKEIRDLHAGYRNYDEKIVDKPAYSQCSRCGLIQNY